MLRFVLFLVCLSLGGVAHAEDLFKQCTGTKEPDAKIGFCTQLIESGDTKNLAIAHMNRGNGYLMKTDYGRAVADLDKSLELNSRLSYSLHLRGMAHVATGNTDKAIADFSKVVEVEPEMFEFYKERGDLYLKAGDKDAAIADYSKAIEYSEAIGIPEADYYCARGEVYADTGDTARADADFKAAEDISGENAYCD